MISTDEAILNENNRDNKPKFKTIKYNNLLYFKDNIFLSSDQYDINKIRIYSWI